MTSRCHGHCRRSGSSLFGRNIFGDDPAKTDHSNEILVSEEGFGAVDAESFQTLDILMAWQVVPVEVP